MLTELVERHAESPTDWVRMAVTTLAVALPSFPSPHPSSQATVGQPYQEGEGKGFHSFAESRK